MVSERVLYDESPGIIPARWLDQAETEIRALTTSDTPAFRALRLDALRLHPEAFVPTYEEERAADSRSVASRFRDDWIHGGNFILGAYREGWLVGAVGVKRWPRQKQRHKATIWIMYTHADFRGKGTGRILLDAASSDAARIRRSNFVHLERQRRQPRRAQPLSKCRLPHSALSRERSRSKTVTTSMSNRWCSM
ncbi:MAG: GNAT family N-acetyltransferase [Thermomicrobiales bacterium]